MGLDITAYKCVILVHECDRYKEEEDKTGRVFLYRNPDFQEQADNFVNGFYTVSNESFGFRAGSYMGYSDWRSELASLISKTESDIWNNPTEGPFVELINFSDCEGIIGPKTSAKLAKDFADWQQEANERLDKYYLSTYNNFRKAFEIASNNGVVQFH